MISATAQPTQAVIAHHVTISPSELSNYLIYKILRYFPQARLHRYFSFLSFFPASRAFPLIPCPDRACARPETIHSHSARSPASVSRAPPRGVFAPCKRRPQGCSIWQAISSRYTLDAGRRVY